MNPLTTLACGLLLALPAPAQQAEQVADDLRADLFPHELPLGLPRAIPQPADNPLTEARFALGRRLFFDPILSQDGTVSCASCHEPARGYASRIARPFGIAGRRSLHDAPSLLNRGFGALQRWDGSAASIEAQALLPIADGNEMGTSVADAVARIAADASYREAFVAACGAPPSEVTLGHALASFVRGLVLGDSPVDRFQAGEQSALTPEEKRGLWIYESKGRCWRCHSGPNFTDEAFHNTGVGWRDGALADGRFAVTGDERDRGAFKTPSLRAVQHTAPYMHDGSLATLEDVVQFYVDGGRQNAHLDPLMQPVVLDDQEQRSLLAFLRALSR